MGEVLVSRNGHGLNTILKRKRNNVDWVEVRQEKKPCRLGRGQAGKEFMQTGQRISGKRNHAAWAEVQWEKNFRNHLDWAKIKWERKRCGLDRSSAGIKSRGLGRAPAGIKTTRPTSVIRGAHRSLVVRVVVLNIISKN
ncbi:hypothetical protein BaRGS_00014116 [Batillaria attramentaria]|uniref:Uncharacterized protein n=1 Tax=Batillaria attramentaria TaxID=370345 RepID=A0ABD0L654_9CAEN